MRQEKQNCSSCIFEDDRNPIMCETCDKRFYTHWKPNAQALKSIKSRNKEYYKYSRKPVKSEFYKYWELSGLTQKRLARKLNVNTKFIRYRCQGMPIQSLNRALEISKKTNIPIIDLICTKNWLKENNLTREHVINGF